MDTINSEKPSNSEILAGYVTLDALSKAIHKSKRTLQRLEAKREGPPRLKIGRLILYNIEAVRQWLESHAESMHETRKLNPDIKSKLLSKKILLTKQR